MKKLTHLDRQGRAKMVDVTGKPVTEREAVARTLKKGGFYEGTDAQRLFKALRDYCSRPDIVPVGI